MFSALSLLWIWQMFFTSYVKLNVGDCLSSFWSHTCVITSVLVSSSPSPPFCQYCLYHCFFCHSCYLGSGFIYGCLIGCHCLCFACLTVCFFHCTFLLLSLPFMRLPCICLLYWDYIDQVCLMWAAYVCLIATFLWLPSISCLCMPLWDCLLLTPYYVLASDTKLYILPYMKITLLCAWMHTYYHVVIVDKCTWFSTSLILQYVHMLMHTEVVHSSRLYSWCLLAILYNMKGGTLVNGCKWYQCNYYNCNNIHI